RVAVSEGGTVDLPRAYRSGKPGRGDANHAGGERLARHQQHVGVDARYDAGVREGRELPPGPTVGGLVLHLRRDDGLARAAALDSRNQVVGAVSAEEREV